MTRGSLLSPLGELVRRHDPDRYYCTLFAPAEKREALFVLYAFNHELARAREAVREPFMALVRLQWWREVIEGVRGREQVAGHEVAGPLGAALDKGLLQSPDLLGMVLAREAETGTIEDRAAFEAYVQESAGGVMVAAGRVLGMPNAEALRNWGAAYGIAGVLRSVPVAAGQGRCLLPRDLLHAAGSSEAAVISDPRLAGHLGVAAQLARLGETWLSGQVEVSRVAAAAALPAILARRDLARARTRAQEPTRRTVGDKIAVAWAAAFGVERGVNRAS